MLKKIIGPLTLCTLFLLPNNSYAKSADERFFERCEQFACEKECRNLLEEYKQVENNTTKLREISEKISLNSFKHSQEKSDYTVRFFTWIKSFFTTVLSKEELDSKYKEQEKYLVKQAKDLIENQFANINDENTPILPVSIAINNPEFAHWLIKHDVNVNTTFDYSYKNTYGTKIVMHSTALIDATMDKYAEMVRILLEAGADATIKDHDGKNALDHAREKKHTAIEKMLVNHMKKTP